MGDRLTSCAQIEEALKLYQRALKLHTDGAWEEARKAYADLFASELFQVDTDHEEQVKSSNLMFGGLF